MMESFLTNELFGSITVWHWLGLGLFLLVVEMTVGTFDLLWISVAAFLTALFMIMPLSEGINNWEGQLIFFAIAAISLVIAGRTVFASWRESPTSHPTLNKRTQSMVGATGKAVANFIAGQGRVKIGDTIWSAEAEKGAAIYDGMTVTVSSAKSTVLTVKPEPAA